MRSARILAAAVLAASGLVAVGLTTETARAATSKDLTVLPSSKVMKNEKYALTGSVGPSSISRRVKLQYKSGSTWKTSGETMTWSGGFSLTKTMTATKTWRFYAPKVTSGGTTYKAVTGNAKKVSLVGQTASGFVTPYGSCSASVLQTVTVVATFSPARYGRIVLFDTVEGEFSGQQDSKGRVAFTFDHMDGAGSFDVKATALSYLGASAKSVTLPYRVSSSYCPLS